MTTIDSSATYTGIADLAVSLDDGVLSVTLNRPDSLNSLTAAMLKTLADTLERAATDPRVRVVRLGGAGRGFCSGAGISADDQANRSPVTPDEVLLEANRAVRSITELPKPVVAVVHGPAAGVGVSLALASDVVLASEKAFFLLAFTKIGLMPDGGASALVAAAIGRIRAMRMALLAERISAVEAYDFGLVSAVHPADELESAVAEVIERLAVGAGGGAAQDQAGDQCGDADRTRGRDRARERRAANPVDVERLPRGHPGIPGTPQAHVHRRVGPAWRACAVPEHHTSSKPDITRNIC